MAMSRSLAGTGFTMRPSIDSTPEVIDSSPAIMRKVVVLPQPDGPRNTISSPSAMVRLTSCTAFSLPPS